MDRIFKLTFCYGRSHIAGPSELSIRFLLDENPLLYLAARAGERSGDRDATALFFAPSLLTLFVTSRKR